MSITAWHVRVAFWGRESGHPPNLRRVPWPVCSATTVRDHGCALMHGPVLASHSGTRCVQLYGKRPRPAPLLLCVGPSKKRSKFADNTFHAVDPDAHRAEDQAHLHCYGFITLLMVTGSLPSARLKVHVSCPGNGTLLNCAMTFQHVFPTGHSVCFLLNIRSVTLPCSH